MQVSSPTFPVEKLGCARFQRFRATTSRLLGYEGIARHYGFRITACNPGRLNEKGRVENAVGYIKSNFLAARGYSPPEVPQSGSLGLDAPSRQSAHAWHDRQTSRLLFAEEEKPALRPLPAGLRASDNDTLSLIWSELPARLHQQRTAGSCRRGEWSSRTGRGVIVGTVLGLAGHRHLGRKIYLRLRQHLGHVDRCMATPVAAIRNEGIQ